MKRLLESYARKFPLDPEKIGSTWTVAPGPFSFWVTGLYLQQNRSVLVVAPSNTEAESMAAEAAWFGAQKQIVHFPGYESIPYRYAGLSWAPAVQRVRVLSRLLNGERLLIFTSADALLRRMPDRSVIERHCIRLHPELEWAPRDLLRRLIDLGYERVDQVEAPGECCLKGEILDVFPVNGEWPLRIDYFDDTIESIRTFDPESQLGRERASEVIVFPAGEYVLDAESGQRLINILENDYPAELERPAWCRADAVLQHGLYTQFHHPGLEEFVGLVEPLSSLEQILGDVIQVRYPNGAVREAMSRITREFQTLYAEEKEQIVCVPPGELLARNALSGSTSSETVPTGLLLVDYLPGTSDPDRTVVTATAGDAPKSTEYDSVPESQAITKEEFTESAESTESNSSPGLHFESEVDAEQALEHASTPASELTGIQEISGFSGRIHEMREKLMEVISSGATVVIASPYAPQMRRLSGIFQSESLDIRLYYEESELEGKDGPGTGRKTKKPALYIIKSPQRQGFIIPELNFYLFTDSEIFGRAYRRRSRFKRVGSTPIESFLDLKEGDYVVHVNHGVGRFVALEKVRAAGRERDFLVLEYADEDRLFVPLDQISMVQRYIAPTEKPKLDSLGKSSFKRVKERVEKRIEEFAEELLRLYALRMSRKGFAFPPDTA
ncbi:MAG: hypothetical protein KDK27_06605, partial [Leptospiraceae bacterium]|nr:hypothetical protein [Leptospiraceae bacterium]